MDPKASLDMGKCVGEVTKFVKESPVGLADRNASRDKSPDKFAPSESCPLKLHHKLAGMT